MSRVVNRRDLDFLLFECFGVERLFSTARYGGLDRATVESVFDTVQTIAEEKFLPFAAALDANEPFFVPEV